MPRYLFECDYPTRLACIQGDTRERARLQPHHATIVSKLPDGTFLSWARRDLCILAPIGRATERVVLSLKREQHIIEIHDLIDELRLHVRGRSMARPFGILPGPRNRHQFVDIRESQRIADTVAVRILKLVTTGVGEFETGVLRTCITVGACNGGPTSLGQDSYRRELRGQTRSRAEPRA